MKLRIFESTIIQFYKFSNGGKIDHQINDHQLKAV